MERKKEERRNGKRERPFIRLSVSHGCETFFFFCNQFYVLRASDAIAAAPAFAPACVGDGHGPVSTSSSSWTWTWSPSIIAMTGCGQLDSCCRCPRFGYNGYDPDPHDVLAAADQKKSNAERPTTRNPAWRMSVRSTKGALGSRQSSHESWSNADIATKYFDITTKAHTFSGTILRSGSDNVSPRDLRKTRLGCRDRDVAERTLVAGNIRNF